MSEISVEMESENVILCVNNVDETARCEKRQREESLRVSSSASIDENGFTTVVRRRPKRLAVHHSSSSDLNDDAEMMKETQQIEKIEVSVTSKQPLPKPMALAKLLQTENIQNILSIKYKGPYKVLIEFGHKDHAHKLITNKRFLEADYRCQLTQGLHMIFGVIRNIDLDVQEQEMVENFKSEFEILSLKRLKRYMDNGDWVESESVRVCFKSSTLPSYIIIYGCRFKVEPFTFPVTQCSFCWRYGHSKKFCPIKKVVCPKCGNQHSNCDTKLYSCINCKGDHMALDRTSCPIYHKEKEIRKIMCKKSCNYREALLIYVNTKKVSNRFQYNNTNEENDESKDRNVSNPERNLKKTYRDILVTDPESHHRTKEVSSNSEIEESDTKTESQKHKKRKKKAQKVEDMFCEYGTENTEKEQHQQKNKEQEKRQKKFDFAKLLLKIKEVCFSQMSFENKIKLLFKVALEEIKMLVLELIKDSDIMKNLFNIFYNGG